MRKTLVLLTAGLLLSLGAQLAVADTITFTLTGTITSPAAGVSSTDSTILNPNFNNNLSDPWSLSFTYDPTNFANTAVETLSIDDSLNGGTVAHYDGFGGEPVNSISFGSAYGAGTTSFQVCENHDCTASFPGSGFLNLYFDGSISGPGDVAGLNALVGDSDASPSEFEMLYTLSDYSQTDVQGTITSVSATETGSSAVPEPASLWMLLGGLGLVGLVETRRRAQSAA